MAFANLVTAPPLGVLAGANESCSPTTCGGHQAGKVWSCALVGGATDRVWWWKPRTACKVSGDCSMWQAERLALKE